MILLLFGPPGCGKGTQAASLAEKLHIPDISTGEVFRAECKSGTELGKMASEIMAKGGLVDDEIVDAMVAKRIAQADCARGFLLDGYPRTVPQAQYFSALLKQRGLPAPIVLHLDVPDDVVVTRLTSRRQCPECRNIYNLLSQPPKAAGICDYCHAPLFTREDDLEPVIRRRLKAYQEQTGPILDWYGPSLVQTIDGSLPSAQVAAAIEKALTVCA